MYNNDNFIIIMQLANIILLYIHVIANTLGVIQTDHDLLLAVLPEVVVVCVSSLIV